MITQIRVIFRNKVIDLSVVVSTKTKDVNFCMKKPTFLFNLICWFLINGFMYIKKNNNIICMFAQFLKVRSHFLKLKIMRLDNFVYIILYSSQNSTNSAYSFSFLEASSTFSNIKNVAFIFLIVKSNAVEFEFFI